MVKKTIL